MAVLLPVLTIALAGCPGQLESSPSTSAQPIYEPQFVGVIVDRRFVDGSTVSLRFRGANDLDVDLNAVDNVRGTGPDVADLFFYGEAGGQPWFMAIPGRDPNCYIVEGFATDLGEAIQFDFGLRLPKAPGFDPGSVSGGRFADPAGPQFCVNADGEVMFLRE